MSPPTSTEESVIKIWATFFPNGEVDSSSHFFDLGGDSLTAINMSLEVERETGFLVPIGTIYNGPILSDFVETVSSFQVEDKRPIVTPLQARGTQPPLFAIAPAIGGVFHYREFGEQLRNDQPCYCLEPRISALGEHSYQSVEEIAEWKIHAIKNIQAEGPYRLCGYSFGGSIAWEVAKILKARGEEVELLLAFDTIARGKGFYQPRFTGSLLDRTKRLIVRFKQLNETYKRHDAKLSWVNVASLVWVKVQYFFKLSVLTKIGLKFTIEEDSVAIIENQVQNTLRCVYDYGTYDGELILLRAKKQLLLRRELDYELGWTNRAKSGLRIIDIAGDHLTLMYGEPVKELIRQYNLIIDKLPKPSADNQFLETLPFPEGSITSPLDRFREIVKSFESRPAIMDNGRFYTYRQLDKLSDTLAFHIENAVDKDTQGIGVYLTNGYEMSATFLAVLKTGKYYVPLDPEHPDERTTAIIESSGVSLIITDNSLKPKAEIVFSKTNTSMVSLDELDLETDRIPPEVRIDPGLPAVILFTSGSTGKPKGVLHNHRSVAYVGWRRGVGIDLKASDRYLSIYSGAFMGFLNGFYASIQFGSCFWFYRLRQRGIEALAGWLNYNKITIFHSVTSVYRRFVNSLDDDMVFTTIRSVTPGGEPSRHSDIERFKKHFLEGTIYYSNLGSSETGSIAFDPILHETTVAQNIPVGFPFEELNLTIRHPDGTPCHALTEGEICLNTGNIFSGYWQDEEKTAEVYMTLPDGSRLFRSGDFGYLMEDGRLINLGRKDNQVKINGYRLELSDVESSFMLLPQIAEIAVVVREDKTSDDNLRLYAFYCLKDSYADTSKEQVRESLLEHLPTPMIPNYLFEVTSLPTNPTGKIDRKLLRNIQLDKVDF